ncbi:FtsX-like permease family protein [Catalinimonas niigatensis]|uniref:FtsX-like permease family protein n=1 Tax=Catalinimonas niigatensis TaxID=1397264 RepID=UPI002665F2EB|nr:FtsX-like permease family protein [Catalinimonas niigatensis]WPP49842.1 FtsX-like permease family protein [Catalinimonas niigatensis]
MKEKQHPPRWAEKLLHWYCPVMVLEEIEGDLLENFYRTAETAGFAQARRDYVYEVLRFCNPVTFRKARTYSFSTYPPLNHSAMLRNFFLTAFRNLSKNKTYAAINVLGLALGIACCVAIFVLVRFETSFDDYHSKAEQVYRVNLNQQNADGMQLNGYNFYPLGEAMRAEVSGLEAVTSMHHNWSFQFKVGEQLYEGEHAFFVDSAYFDVFDGQWLAGNPDNAFDQPNTVVVTDQFAEKYLGGVDKAMDTTFLFDNKLTLKVNGILEAPPYNTDMPYSMLISYPSLPAYVPESVDNWEWVGWGATFFVLDQGLNTEQIDQQLDKMIHKYLPEETAKNTSFHLMHLGNNHDKNGNYNSFTYDFPLPLMIILSVMAGMIAFIACINFINLATAQSLTRAREVGIRKTMGSSRFQLILQYMSEAFVITCIAVIAGLALAKIPMRIMNADARRDYLNFDFFQQPSILLFLIGIVLLITLLAGFYPAFVLSGFVPVKALKGKISTGKPKGLNLRRGLVITQFFGAQILILITVIVIQQLNDLKERPLGFDAEAIIFSYIPDTTTNIKAFKQQLAQNSNIQNVTLGWGGASLNAQGITFYGDAGEDFKTQGVVHYGDEQYVQFFERELLAGSNFSEDQNNPLDEVIVNQSLIKALGIEKPEEAIGNVFTMDGKEVLVRGVIQDFYTQALSSKIDPLVVQYDPSKFKAVAVQVAPQHFAETIQLMEGMWERYFPEYLYNYQFLDEALDRQYSFLNNMIGLLEPFAFLAIFIGCMGLYGLISFMAVQRTKEVGIRKVLGASISQIIVMFTKESLLLIVIAFVIAAPAGYYMGQIFLMELPERIDPTVSIFILTLMASLTIALLTIYYRSFRAAIANPADALRYE